MTVGPDWLFDECYVGKPSYRYARQIYRAMLLTAKRSHHVFDINSDAKRREIVHGINHLRVPLCVVACARCGCEAWLTDWIKASLMTPEQRMAIVEDNPVREEIGLLEFLKPCPGGGYVQQTYEPTQPPEVLNP